MPGIPKPTWNINPVSLFEAGVDLARRFLAANGLEMPPVNVIPKRQWTVGACAYYRPPGYFDKLKERFGEDRARERGLTDGINVCLEHCGSACGETESRNWSWPGSTTDRTPFGVVCHEAAHHLDWSTGGKKGAYFSDFCEAVKAAAGEPGVTSYAEENPAEWFAEAGRLFITNPSLLRDVRPRTYAVFRENWEPVSSMSWKHCLGENVPARVLRTLRNKGAGR